MTDLTKKVVQISEKGYDFLLGRIYLQAMMVIKIFLLLPERLVVSA